MATQKPLVLASGQAQRLQSGDQLLGTDVSYSDANTGLGATDVQAAVDDLNAIVATGGNANAQGTWLVSGGGVAWVSGYIFIASPAQYYIVGIAHTSPQTQLTLAAADPTFSRFDVIAGNASGAVAVIQGTAAATPDIPPVDPQTYCSFTVVRVDAGTTAPTLVTSATIYDENVGTPAEWTGATSGTGIVLGSTSNPYHGTKDVEGTSVAAGAYFEFVAGSSLDVNTYTNLVFYIRSKASWGKKSLVVAYRTSAAQVGGSVALADGFFGFSSANTTTYQQIVIPITQFAIAPGTTCDRIRFAISGGGASIGFYFDYAQHQGGTGGTGSTSLTQTQADARYAQRSANLSDLASASTARTNLGLGTAATHAATDFATAISLATPNVLYATPVTFSDSGGTFSGTLSLNTQSANTVFAGPTTGTAATPTMRALVAADIPNIAESQVTNLTSDLAAKAPLASPTFTGTPAAPTATAGTNTTQLATTAFVTTAVAAVSGGGTVTSVGLSLPAIFTVTNSPVTGSGTLTGTLATQSANAVWAGPATGTAAAPTFRALVAADIPSIAESQVTNLTTDLAAKAQALARTSVKATAYTAAAGDLVPVDTTSGAVTITLAAAPADRSRVAIKHIVQGGSNNVTVAAGGADVFNKASGSTSFTLPLLNQGVLLEYDAATAIWTVISDDLPLSQLDARYLAPTGNGSGLTGLTGAQISGDISGNAANVTGTVAIAHGGTGQVTAAAAFDALSPVTTLGDLSYRGTSSNVRLAGNTTTAKNFLAQTGTGSASAAPAWGTIATGDVSGLGTAATHAATDFATAISLAAPSVLYSTPVTFSNSGGTFSGTLSLVTQSANTVFAGPTTGTAATPTMRSLVAADIPNIAESQVTNLTTDLAAKAPLASPSFTGTVKIQSHYGDITTDADGATVTFDCSVTDWHQVTLGGNRTLAVSNDVTGQQFTIVLIQDGTGSRTVTWWGGIKWAVGTVPTLTTTATKADIFTFKKTGTGAYYGFVAGQNF